LQSYPALAAEYPALVEEAIERQANNPGGAWMVSELLRTLKLRPPEDA
jgi:hypothetical protein